VGRNRKKADQWMPPYVYRGKAAYEYRFRATGEAIRLCSLECSQATVWQRYENERARLEKKEGSLSELIERFVQSEDFKSLSPTTQSDYRKYSLKVEEVFGRMRASSIKPEHVRRYMDLRGRRSRVQANREKSFLSRVYQWGYERGLVVANPCKGVRKFTEKSRDRYITDEEYGVTSPLAAQDRDGNQLPLWRTPR